MQAALKVTFSNITIIKSSVARLDDFWKLSATKFLAKEAQMIGNFLGYFEKPHSYVKKNTLATSWATFGKNWATFTPTSGYTDYYRYLWHDYN